uniref:Uncharacterized protein n=1 Tax=Ascaris lumbricoides TaxID=6252 RepID=A0A0M3IIL3_ASCLU
MEWNTRLRKRLQRESCYLRRGGGNARIGADWPANQRMRAHKEGSQPAALKRTHAYSRRRYQLAKNVKFNSTTAYADDWIRGLPSDSKIFTTRYRKSIPDDPFHDEEWKSLHFKVERELDPTEGNSHRGDAARGAEARRVCTKRGIVVLHDTVDRLRIWGTSKWVADEMCAPESTPSGDNARNSNVRVLQTT